MGVRPAHVFHDMQVRTGVRMAVREVFVRLISGGFRTGIMAVVIQMMGFGKNVVRMTERRKECNDEEEDKKKRSGALSERPVRPLTHTPCGR